MSIYVGAKAPEHVDLLVVPKANDSFDPSTASNWVVKVVCPNGAQKIWAITVESATAEQAHLRHVFSAAGGDVPRAGDYRIQITCDTPAGARRSFKTVVPAKDV